ncbi:MAG TPA: lytic transglycosylase domain-containing protein [Alphaproteobacteria bacterium]|nr:lytic transglycosylase domain-containing protein [Alphaproteobacteria bacterium]
MTKHRSILLIIAATMVSSLSVRAQSIVPVQDGNGRTIWVNNEDSKPQTKSQPAAGSSASPYKGLVYWSRSERRWMPVPTASAPSMLAARKAAKEVTDFVQAAPASSKNSRVKVSSQPVSLGAGSLTQGRTVSSESVERAIEASADRHGVDPNLVRAIIKVESDFNPQAVSRKGAMGLMQLMPTTARSLNVNNAFDPRQNVDAGVRHLKSLLQNYNGDLELSLAAYNAGSGAVRRSGGVPPYRETRAYVNRIKNLYSGGPGLFTFGSRVRMTQDQEGHRVFTTE